MRRSNGLWALLGFGAAVAGTAWLGSRYNSHDSRTRLWYRRLDKPFYTPPDFVFPIVWSFLYTLMAISGWRVWQHRKTPQGSSALRWWLPQLILNEEWTRLFFDRHLPTWSMADILSLQIAIIGYIVAARKVDKSAAVLFVPYAAWVAFAALLNEEIIRRNPSTATMFPQARTA